MDVRQLRVFVAVVRHGGFTRAARELHLVQSAVSTTVAALERDVGQQLIDRTARKTELTAAGAALYHHAVGILDDVRAAQDAVDAVRGELTGTVRVGYMTNVRLFDLPALLGEFHAEHPGVRLRLAPAAAGTAGLVQGLVGGDIDVAFLSLAPHDHPDLDVEVLAEAALGLVVPDVHPLAGREEVAIAETADLPFVDFPLGFAARTQVDAELERGGLRREVQIESADLHDVAMLVRHGLGVAFLPRYVASSISGLRWVALTDADLTLRVSVATARRRAVSAAARRLATRARAVPVEVS